MSTKTLERYFISVTEYSKYIKYGKEELAFLLNDERFLSLKNCNHKFKKHLGFILELIKVPAPVLPKELHLFDLVYKNTVVIYDKQKLMLFKIKYGI